ncbi:glycosyltransferase [Conexibacter woesei]|uniref:Glycosyltransferase subfamily 4-like N-terminal domain-containing protein n=1 Tax=Conexibacter woesei (strain DSM 14684 / CCUG 47730 / CIP 108061 / JCM 11494 / NBRC 100937 / ID131577) TaxID=469383 RepID=D3EZP9_CONWI|nr:glycosyltransferase [Conexibacter woesei]ADB53887.1 hypothetical protein Cwoe_5482 [Conexibacter woesei DSM 14684]
MTWDEPLEIARRLAIRLDTPLQRWPEPGEADGGVLLVADAQLDDVPAERLAGAGAVLVAGAAGSAVSAALVALGARVAAHGLDVAFSSFATTPGTDGAPIDVGLVVAAPAGDVRVRELLAAGPHALTLDAAVDVAAVSPTAPPARVCVVSFEVSGMTGGGIGTASTSLAESLARSGHDVTLLFTGWQNAGGGEQNEQWRRHYAERDVRLEIVRAPGVQTVGNPHFPARSAYEVYCWLHQAPPFDVVHLPENMGHGAYAQLAKRQGRAFVQTTFVVGTHGPTRWAAEANRVALTREEFLVNEALEHTSVALADVLLGPSRYLHDYLRERDWTLPARVHVQPYAVPAAVRARRIAEIPAAVHARVAAADGRSTAGEAAGLPDEIVFFGRLETRKGVATLCDALDRLAETDDVPPFSVTFLGPVAEVLGQRADSYIAARAERWPWSCQVVSDRDQQGAAEYLGRPGVLAVMPSTVDNAPNTVSEAIALGIPLVAGRTGGTGELVAAEQRDDHMFGAPDDTVLLPLPLTSAPPAPEAGPLAELLLRRLTRTVEPARPASTSAAVDAAYDRWHRAVRHANDTGAGTDRGAQELPALAVCILFDGDDALLGAQLDVLAADDAEVELVVADVRQDPREPIEAAVERGLPVVQPRRPGHAAEARAAAVAATRGELVAIVPPGDVPLPPFADVLRSVAAATDADVYACVVLDEVPRDADADDAEASTRDALVHAFVPLSGPPLAGLTHPLFSAGPYAIRRAALTQLGGFAADARGEEADHELLNRAAATGLRLEVVSEPLAAKRRADAWSALRAGPQEPAGLPYDAEQWLRVERPLAREADAAADLVGLLRGTRGEADRLQAVLAEQQHVYEGRLAEQRIWIDDLEQKVADFRKLEAELLAEAKRLRALTEEMSQSAAQLTVRTLRNAGRRAAGRLRR